MNEDQKARWKIAAPYLKRLDRLDEAQDILLDLSAAQLIRESFGDGSLMEIAAMLQRERHR